MVRRAVQNGIGSMGRVFMLLIAVLMLSSCSKNRFTIEMDLEGDVTGNYTLLYYASNSKKGTLMEMGIPLSQGKAHVECPSYNPTFVYIFEGSSTRPAVVVYAEHGDKIKVTGKGDDPRSWMFGGNKLNEQWSRWRNANATELRSRDAYRINKVVAQYVKKNPDDELSALLLLTSYSRYDDPRGFADLWRSLPEKVRESKKVALLGRADLLEGIETAPTVKSIRLPAQGDSMVTLTPAKKEATLIWFWRQRNPEYRRVLDSLTYLQRHLPDSAHMVADVSFMADTLAWHRSLASDSVKWTRLWAPGAQMNMQLRDMGVGDLPWYVVLDRKGEQRYAGRELDEALKAFRGIKKR